MSVPDGRQPAAVIFGCAGHSLSADEAALFREANPLGFILFARNIDTPDQVRRLTGALRATVGRDDTPVLIDQEGGRVQRLRPPHWRRYPPMRALGDIADRDPETAAGLTFLVARLIADDLATLGIDVNCAPVLDVPAPDGHEIIGDRAFGDDPVRISALGRAVCDGLMHGGVMPVIKHIPGHGRATADSHVELPRVGTAAANLSDSDFAPFRALRDAPAGMTAHVVYDALDPDRPASASPAVIGGTIRGDIGFDGFLMSDDVCMKALDGPLEDRVRRVLAAGCDAALHCDGVFADMAAIADSCPPLRTDSAARWEKAVARRGDSVPFDRKAAESRISAVFGA